MLLDSNIIIYAAMPENEKLRNLIQKFFPKISTISKLEVLGYPKLSELENLYFRAFFDAANLIPVSNTIIEKAIELRQVQKISIGDSLIAATALTNNLKLVTRNTKDFKWIKKIEIINPFEEE